MDSTINNPYIPYTGQLPHALQPGNIIRIQGIVKPSATCFSINLQNGASTMPRSDVALHLSPVFSPPPRLVRNSLQSQQWGAEESHGSYFPFSPGQNFEILIVAEPDTFKIAVNGQHYTEFCHRLPLHAISHISIDGDVNISIIKFESTSASRPSYLDSKSDINMPIGFVTPGSATSPSNPTAGYGAPPLPYPSGDIGPQRSTSPYQPPPSSPSHAYGRTSPYGPPGNNPYGPPPGSNPYGPPPGSNPYGPPPGSNPYGPPPGSNPYGPPPGGYPGSTYPQGQAYPGAYPSQTGPYPGTTVVYPGQEGHKSSSGNLGTLAAGAAAVAGAAGAALMGSKHKGGKHGHLLNPGAALMGGHSGPAGLLAGGVGSLLGTGHHGHKSSASSGIPMGGALAGGAAALAGAYVLSKSPVGKIMKPKKMKKLYKHKHKLKHGFKGFGSSSSSSSSEEE